MPRTQRVRMELSGLRHWFAPVQAEKVESIGLNRDSCILWHCRIARSRVSPATVYISVVQCSVVGGFRERLAQPLSACSSMHHAPGSITTTTTLEVVLCVVTRDYGTSRAAYPVSASLGCELVVLRTGGFRRVASSNGGARQTVTG